MNSNVSINVNVKEVQKEPQDIVLWMAEQRDIFGSAKSRQEVMKNLKKERGSYRKFQKLSPELKEEFLLFCMGERGLKITYDPVFKMIFNPETKPGRLEEFLGLCLGETVKILQVMSNESHRLTEEGSLLIMDILVKLKSGALVNVEIQRMGYLFPGARCACYSSDLMMRQYSKVKSQRKEEGKKFSYKDIKRVYTIVLIQNSTKEFHDCPDEYLHYARQTFNTGLKLDLLQEYLLVPLDVFLDTHHKIRNKLDAWLYFIASDKPEDIRNVIEAYPEFKERYQEVFRFRYQKKELLGMYSKALQMLDLGTVEYMVELQKEELEKQKAELEQNKVELEQNKAELEQNKVELEQNKVELEQNKVELEKDQIKLKQKDDIIKSQREEIERLKKQLQEKI